MLVLVEFAVLTREADEIIYRTLSADEISKLLKDAGVGTETIPDSGRS